MCRKFFLCIVLIFSILVAGCGKTELEAVETVNVTFNAGLTGNPELAKGTTVEEDVTIFTVEMDNQIRSLLKNVFKIDNKAILSDDEFERMVYAYHKLLAKSKIDVKYMMRINPIVERKRTLNLWDMVNDTHSSGKAWDLVYNGGLGNHKIISKKLIKNKG